MIVAIEGASAAGKSTWCRLHFPHQHVAETAENIAAPDLFADPAEVGQFWVKHAIESWQRALAIERENGIAVCDGDPFHLYFSWALWKARVLGQKLFEIESELYRSAFDKKQIGMVDHVLWLEVSIEELRRRAQADFTRRRKRHQTYLGLVPWMTAWFAQRERILPHSVHAVTAGLVPMGLGTDSESKRYDTAVIGEILHGLRGV
jgi:hypothetical protein